MLTTRSRPAAACCPGRRSLARRGCRRTPSPRAPARRATDPPLTRRHVQPSSADPTSASPGPTRAPSVPAAGADGRRGLPHGAHGGAVRGIRPRGGDPDARGPPPGDRRRGGRQRLEPDRLHHHRRGHRRGAHRRRPATGSAATRRFWVEQTGDPAAGAGMVGQVRRRSPSPTRPSSARSRCAAPHRRRSRCRSSRPWSRTRARRRRPRSTGGRPTCSASEGGARLWVAADGSGTLLRAVGPKTAPSDLVFSRLGPGRDVRAAAGLGRSSRAEPG